MIINKVLDEVFSGRSNIMVMRALKNSQTGLTGREICRNAGISPKAGLKALSYLEELGLVNRVRGGRDHIFTLNRDGYIVQHCILPLLELELTYREALLKDISDRLKKQRLGVYLFGSVARKEETIMSDLDICILYDSSKEKSILEDLVSELKPKLYKKYGVNIAPIYISEKDFIKNARNNKPPVPGIIREGISLFGKPIKQVINGKSIAKDKR